MKIIKYLFLPIVWFLDYFNWSAHMENYRYYQDSYEPYKTLIWIDKYYKT